MATWVTKKHKEISKRYIYNFFPSLFMLANPPLKDLFNCKYFSIYQLKSLFN